MPEKRSWLKFSIAFIAFVLSVLSVTGYALWLLRMDAIHSNFRIATLLVQSFENLITQSLDATTLAAGNRVPSDDSTLDVDHIEAGFLRILRSSPHLRSLSLLDASHRIIVSSNPANVGLTVATGSYFPNVNADQQVLRIGLPWVGRDFSQGRVSTSKTLVDDVSTFIPVVQPLETQGSHMTLLVALNPDYFQGIILQQLDIDVGTVEVLRLDAIPLLATAPTMMAGDHPNDEIAKLRLDEHEFGQFEYDAAPGHGQQTLSAFQVSRLYPFVVVVHLWRDVALQRWMNELKTIAVVVLPILIALCVLAVAFYRRQLLLKAQQAESERLQRVNAACVFSNTREGIIITDANGTIMDVNDAFTHITGYHRDEVVGRNPNMLSSGCHDRAFYDVMWRDLKETGHWDGEIWNHHKNGDVIAEKLTISAVPDSKGHVQQYVAVFSDITDIKNYQNELEHIARYDALTHLPNRLMLSDRLCQAMMHALRREQWLGVVFIDLDRFKFINDTYGHDAGDQVLVTVSTRMRQVLRDGDTLARNGGDEFVAVLVDLADASDALPLLDRLLVAAAEPIEFGSFFLQVSASIGISFYGDEQSKTTETLMREADMAMYQAKLAGKNQYRIFDPCDYSH